MEPLILISRCWLLKKTLIIRTNMTNPKSTFGDILRNAQKTMGPVLMTYN